LGAGIGDGFGGTLCDMVYASFDFLVRRQINKLGYFWVDPCAFGAAPA
jgi:hypothetical protein